MIDFFKAHKQINDVCYGDKRDFNANRNLTYPAINIEYMESNTNGKKLTHIMNMTLADLADENIEGIEDEIYSDMLLVAEDFFAWAQEQEGFDFNKSVNIQKFVDDMGDRTSGINFKVQLSTIRSQNVCAIPKI